MTEICFSPVNDNEATVSYEPRSRAARRRRMEIRNSGFVSGDEIDNTEQHKRPKVEEEADENNTSLFSRDGSRYSCQRIVVMGRNDAVLEKTVNCEAPKFGFSSLRGRRREMEDAVTCTTSFSRETGSDLHYFGVFDGHGCTHVAMGCRDRMHEIVKEELENRDDPTSSIDWTSLMRRSFARIDQEVIDLSKTALYSDCKCGLRKPECDAVGSTAVVAVVTPDKIIVANCGDSRAVLCRGGKAIALSSDHKPDRQDELERIESVGGRVIDWDVPRVMGVLAMSRAIGDSYLKPYVICDPEVTIIERTTADECLILGSDGLWDVVSNQTACGVAKLCLSGNGLKMPPWVVEGDKACGDSSMVLTKLALARHSTDNVSAVVVDLRKELKNEEL